MIKNTTGKGEKMDEVRDSGRGLFEALSDFKEGKEVIGGTVVEFTDLTYGSKYPTGRNRYTGTYVGILEERTCGCSYRYYLKDWNEWHEAHGARRLTKKCCKAKKNMEHDSSRIFNTYMIFQNGPGAEGKGEENFIHIPFWFGI